MTAIIIVAIVSFGISMLTLFSGFGLGTVLMPVFALFFPLPVAIASTAIVHLANNIFKVILVGKSANWSVVLRFALPGALAAIGGAFLLRLFVSIPVLFSYNLGSRTCEVTAIKLCIGTLILFFSILELTPFFKRLQFPSKYLPLGGLISGFFGGLSGHQGAFRSVFLIKSGLKKEAFIATGVMSSVIVDISRLSVYGFSFYLTKFEHIGEEATRLVLIATIMAFLGAWLGKNLLKKMTVSIVQNIVAGCLMLLSVALIAGVV